jgi:hypothetical protein
MEYEEYYLEQQPNKPVFPSGDTNGDGFLGINFREALILALAGNSEVTARNYIIENPRYIIEQADLIIAELVKERKKK